MAKEKNYTKGSHFLPKAYLKNFLLDGQLFMYKKGEKFFDGKLQSTDRIITIRGEAGLNNVAKENGLYFYENLDGFPPDFMEDFFNELVEGKITPLLKEVANLSPRNPIPKKIKAEICHLMASTMLRAPGHKALNEELYQSFLARQFEIGGVSQEERDFLKNEYKKNEGKELSDEDINASVQAFIDGKLKVKISSKHFVQLILKSLEHYTTIFFGMKMNIIRSGQKNPFFTSDEPVSYFVPKNKVDFYNAPRSLASPHTECFFPLSKDFCVLLHRRKGTSEIMLSPSSEVYAVVENTVSCLSRDYIFAPQRNPTLDEFAEKHIPYPFKLVRR